MISKEWKVVKLGDVLEPKGYIRGPFGSALRRNELLESGIPVYEQQNAIYNHREFRFYIDDKKYDELKRFTVKENDLMISCSGTVGKVSIIQKDDPIGIISQALLLLRGDVTKIDPMFFYYFLTSKEGQNSITSVSSGSVQVNIAKRNIVENITINLPGLAQQKSIAETLSCLDDKIELNNRISKNLEEIAQAIFKSWFVDFEPFQDGEFEDSELGRIPKGWRVGTLGDIAEITMGQSPKGCSYNEDGEGEVFYQGRTDFGSRYPTIRIYTTEPKRRADKGDILLSVRAPVGDINVASEDCCIGRGLASLKTKNKCNSYLLYQLLNLKDSFNVYNGEGTVFGSINKDTLNNMRVLIPSEDKMKEFQYIIGGLDEIIENNSIQVRNLIVIRYTLIPKLMSGEIRIPIEEVQ